MNTLQEAIQARAERAIESIRLMIECGFTRDEAINRYRAESTMSEEYFNRAVLIHI